MHLNPIDFVLAAIVLFGATSGWSRGFLVSALDLLTLAISLAAAFLPRCRHPRPDGHAGLPQPRTR